MVLYQFTVIISSGTRGIRLFHPDSVFLCCVRAGRTSCAWFLMEPYRIANNLQWTIYLLPTCVELICDLSVSRKEDIFSLLYLIRIIMKVIFKKISINTHEAFGQRGWVCPFLTQYFFRELPQTICVSCTACVSAGLIVIIFEPREPRGLLAVHPTPPDDTLHIQRWIWRISH